MGEDILAVIVVISIRNTSKATPPTDLSFRYILCLSRTVQPSIMASHPPQKCCLEGVKHEGEATGTFGKIADKCTNP
jgi:hypothetical protein